MRLAPALVTAWAILGAQEVRLGPVHVPSISPWWAVVAVAVAILVSPGDARPGGVPGSVLVTLALATSLVGALLWWSASRHPALELVLRLDDGREVKTTSIQIGERRELRRLSGARRNIVFETSGWLQIPRSGEYRFDFHCDDSCELAVGDWRVSARGAKTETTQLSRGELPFRLRYRQKAGPAALLLSWDRPGFVELLPIEHFVRGPSAPRRDRTASYLALATLLGWSGVFTLAFPHVVRFARSRALPIAAMGLVITYGGVLRFEAFLARSGLARSSARGAAFHERLLPLMPSYAVFNPENAPLDPYRADVRSYLDGAETMTRDGFYGPSFREPFYVALVKGFVALSGGEIGILIESLVLSIATLVLFAMVAHKLFGLVWTAALLVPVAIHEWLVLESATGYRMSAYGLFFLAFAGWTFLSGNGRAIVSAGTGMLAGLLCLIRLSALSVIVPLVTMRLLQLSPKERARHVAVVTGIVLVLVGPFLASNLIAHGDPFYSISFHTEFWLRAEGLDEGQGAVSWMRYFTDYGRTSDLARGTLAGLTVLPLRTFWVGLRQFPLVGAITLVCGVLGLAIAVGRRPFLPLAYLGHLVPFAYIQNFSSGAMPRFVMPAFFFLVLAAPLGARGLAARVRQLANSSITKRTSSKRVVSGEHHAVSLKAGCP